MTHETGDANLFKDNDLRIMDPLFLDPIAETLLEQEPDTKLETKKQKKARLMEQLRKTFRDYQSGFENVNRLLLEGGFKARGDNDEGLLSDLSQYTQQMAKGNKTMQDIVGLTEEEMSQIYDIGADHYHREDYQNARDIFIFLITCNARMGKYWAGLGMAEQMSGHFDTALNAYGVAVQQDPDNPTLFLYIANCLVHLNHQAEAIELLDKLIEDIGSIGQWKDIKADAEDLKKKWQQAAA